MQYIQILTALLRSPLGISVCLSVAIMIIAIAVVAGFKAEIRGRATGFMGSVMLIQPGQAPLNEQYPFSEKLSYRERLAAEPGVTGVSGVAWRSGLIKTDENIDGLLMERCDVTGFDIDDAVPLL